MFDVTLKLTYTDTDAKGVETVTKRDLDLRRMFIRETDEMKSLTGWVPIEWLSWLDQRDGRALGYAWYLACQRSGDDITWLEILDGLNLFGLEFELVGNDVAEAAPETANPDDPTSPTKSEMTN